MKKLIKFLIISMIVILTIVVVLEILGTFGALGFTNGCLLRYNIDKDNKINNGVVISDIAYINGSGYYNANLDPDAPDSYGKWMKSNVFITKDMIDKAIPITFSISGKMSLCKSYIPQKNLQSNNNYPGDDPTVLIEVPRVGEENYVSLIFNSVTYGSSFRNVVSASPKDSLLLIIHPNSTDPQTQPIKQNMFNDSYGPIPSADCTVDMKVPVKTTSPLCGRYPLPMIGGVCKFQANPNPVPTHLLYQIRSIRCHYRDSITQNPRDFDQVPNGGANRFFQSLQLDEETYCTYRLGWDRHDNADSIDYTTWGYAPTGEKRVVDIDPYSKDNERDVWPDTGGDASNCNNCPVDPGSGSDQPLCFAEGTEQEKMWFTADNRVGLQYRIGDENNSQITDPQDILQILSTNPAIANPYSDGESPPYAIFNGSPNVGVGNTDPRYFQLAFEPGAGPGGYVVDIQHTKCVRSNGEAFADSGSDGLLRGQVRYLILGPGQDVNVDPSLASSSKIIEFGNDGSSDDPVIIDTDQQDGGFLWFKIDNVQEDYTKSQGTYSLKVSYSMGEGEGFLTNILNPIFEIVKNKIFTASESMFERITCSKGESGCINYIDWVHAFLTIYLIMTGIQFLLGMANFNAHELLLRIIKVIIVAGLINGNTFATFKDTVFPLITGTMDEIIANIGGYNIGQGVTAPFVFIDTLMTRVFLNKAFYAQLLSVFSLGLLGIPFFMLICYSLVLALSCAIRVISIYLVALMFLALLIVIAPIFLTFMLFERTRYLFNNWVSYTVRYSLEPVLVIAGIIVLFQLHEIYLDQVLGHSVCWKCAWPFRIPFVGLLIPGLPSFDPNLTLFCINWFVPWGFEFADPSFSISFYDIIALVILSQCMSHYIEFITQASGRLFAGSGTSGAPSVAGGAMAMSGTFNRYAESAYKQTSVGRYFGGIGGEYSTLKSDLKAGWRGEDKYGDEKNFTSVLSQKAKKFVSDSKTSYTELKQDARSLPQRTANYAKSLPMKGVGFVASLPQRAWQQTLLLPRRVISQIIPDDLKRSPEKGPAEKLSKEIDKYLVKEKLLLSSIGTDIGAAKISGINKDITVKEKAEKSLKSEGELRIGATKEKSYLMENAIDKVRKQELLKHVDILSQEEEKKLLQDPKFSSLTSEQLTNIVENNVLERFKSEQQNKLDLISDKHKLETHLEKVDNIIESNLQNEIKVMKDLGYNLSNNEIVRMVDERRKYIPLDSLRTRDIKDIENELTDLSNIKISDYKIDKEVTESLSKEIAEQNRLGQSFTKKQIQDRFDLKKADIIKKSMEE